MPRSGTKSQRYTPTARWEDLVLPDREKQTLRAILSHARHCAGGPEELSFGVVSAAGVTVLFSGSNGTAKTLAAEILASELGWDIYRVDLATVVHKYIGETEKNIRRGFEEAEDSDVVLLLDNTDALFGERSEGDDSHDRYANMEVAFLLQRIETYRGLVILTSTSEKSLDTSFLRRLLCVVRFPLPEPAGRR